MMIMMIIIAIMIKAPPEAACSLLALSPQERVCQQVEDWKEEPPGGEICLAFSFRQKEQPGGEKIVDRLDSANF